MSDVQNASGEVEGFIDPFSIFNTQIEDITSFEERKGTDWSKIFFEPDPKKGKNGTYSCVIKFCMNIYDPRNPIERKNTYELPWPNNPTKKFKYDSPSSIGLPCNVMQSWFDHRNSADAMLKAAAGQLKRKQKACCVIQVIKDLNHAENDGQFFLFRFPGGMEIDNMIKTKVNPAKDQIELGAKPQNIFDPFNSYFMILKCTESTNGRDFSQSSWSEDKSGLRINGKFLQDSDRTNPEIQKQIVELLKSDHINIKEHFSFKQPSEELQKRVIDALNLMFSGKLPMEPAKPDTNQAASTGNSPATTGTESTNSAGANAPSDTKVETNNQTNPASNVDANPSVDLSNQAAISNDDFMKSLKLG